METCSQDQIAHLHTIYKRGSVQMLSESQRSKRCAKPLLTGPEVGFYDYPRLHRPRLSAGPANRGFSFGGLQPPDLSRSQRQGSGDTRYCGIGLAAGKVAKLEPWAERLAGYAAPKGSA